MNFSVVTRNQSKQLNCSDAGAGATESVASLVFLQSRPDSVKLLEGYTSSRCKEGIFSQMFSEKIPTLSILNQV